MKLPRLPDLDVEEKRVIVRMDLDVSDVDNDSRLKVGIPTLKYLAQKNAKVVIIGHRGRPGGKVDEKWSLKPVAEQLEKLLTDEIGEEKMKALEMNVMENLRYNPGEEANDDHFAEHLAEHGDYYVNEAFGNSHREHASIVGLPKHIKGSAVGFHFADEVKNLSKVLDKPKKPVVVVLSGVKEGKLEYLTPFKDIADKILLAGRLPVYVGDVNKDTKSLVLREEDSGCKVVVANLIQDKEDITVRSIEVFEKEIVDAGTIILSGPIGKFEEEGHRQGTKRVFEAIANSSAYKVAGGGDTYTAIKLFKLEDKFDWFSVGGGAMLEYLTKGTLSGIEALEG